MARKRLSLGDEIREAIRQSGRTCYDIASAMKTPPSTIWRFEKGQSGLSMDMLNRLAEELDLHIVVGARNRGE